MSGAGIRWESVKICLIADVVGDCETRVGERQLGEV